MPLTAIRRYSFAERIERAQTLASAWTSASEALQTCENVLRFQQSLRIVVEDSNSRFSNWEEERLPRQIDLDFLLPHFRELLRAMPAIAPAVLRDAARNLETAGAAYWQQALQQFWQDAPGAPDSEHFFLQAFLQPIAEYMAQEADVSVDNHTRPTCPYCGRKPVCGVLRPLGDGAKRSLICSFCGTEWEYRRIVCPACEQDDVELLPVYTAESFAYIRVEACEVCRSFIKTIDLTQQGLAIPVIDELGSIFLTLWAQEKGYRKLERNLLLM